MNKSYVMVEGHVPHPQKHHEQWGHIISIINENCDKQKDEKLYLQMKGLYNSITTDDQLRLLNHAYNTQVVKAMNKSIFSYVPKG